MTWGEVYGVSSRDVALQVIKPPPAGGKRERVPVALLSGGTWTFRQRGLALKDVLDNPAIAAPVIAEVNSQVHSDIVWPGSGYHNIIAHLFGGKIKFRPQGNIDVLAPAFSRIADIDNIDAGLLDTHPWIVAIRRIIGEVDSLIGQDYLIGTSSWGPFTLAGQLYGVEKMMSGLYKDPTGIHALLEAVTEICYRYLSPAIARGALLLSVAEPTASGDLISLRHFEQFVAPYLARLIDRLQQDGALVTLHICGNIQDRVGFAATVGADLLSVDYKVDLRAAADKLAGKVALAGNLNPVTLKDSSPEVLAVLTRELLQKAADYPRYILMPGCDIPPGVPLPNLQAFFAAGLGWEGNKTDGLTRYG